MIYVVDGLQEREVSLGKSLKIQVDTDRAFLRGILDRLLRRAGPNRRMAMIMIIYANSDIPPLRRSEVPGSPCG